MFQHLWFLLSLASKPFSLVDHLRSRHFCCTGRSLGGPYTHKLPPSINSISLGCCLCRVSIFGTIQVPDLSPASIEGVSTALSWWRALLSHLWRPLFFEFACLLALLWCVWFFSDNNTGYVGRRSCRTPVLHLLDWIILLVLSLIFVVGREDVKF